MDQAMGIGAWLLRPSLGQLIPWPLDQAEPDLSLEHSDQVQHLPPRLVQLLVVLASQPGQLWRREDLIEALWPDRLVNEEALSRAVSQLRQMLGDRSGQPRYIATIPKQGYRLVASLRSIPAAGLAQTAESHAPTEITVPLGPDEPDKSAEATDDAANTAADTPPLHDPAAPDSATSSAQRTTIELPSNRPKETRKRWRLALLLSVSLSGLLLFAWLLRAGFNSAPQDSDPGQNLAPAHQALPGEAYRQAILAAQRITAHPGVEHFVEISAAGTHLAYVAVRDGQYRAFVVATANSDQWWALPFSVMDGSERAQISPVFSPDGQQLALAELSDNGCQIVVLPLHPQNGPLQPGDWRQLGPCRAQGLLPILDWSADGRYLAFTDNSDDQQGIAIWQLDLGNGQRQQLTRPNDPYLSDARPRYSPDQRWLSFSRGSNAFRELHLLPLGTSHGERQLSIDHQYTQSHAWMNDSTALVFDSDRSGERALWLLPLSAEGRAAPLHTLGARGAQYPSIARNTGALAFQVAEYEANLWPVEQQQLAAQPTVQSTKYDNNPAFSPDGEWLAFVSNRGGHGALWLARKDGSEQRKLYQPDVGRAAWPVWSPDGQALYFIHYQSAGQWLSRLDLAALTVTRLALPHQAFSPMFSSDGSWFCYTALLPGDGTQIWGVATEDLLQRAGNQRPEAGMPAQPAVLNPLPLSALGANRGCLGDEGRLYYSRHDIDGIVAAAPGADEEHIELIIPGQSSAHWQSWLLHAGWIAYLGEYETQQGIWRHRTNHGNATDEALAAFLPSALPPNLAIASEDGPIIVAMTDRAEADLFYAPLVQATR